MLISTLFLPIPDWQKSVPAILHSNALIHRCRKLPLLQALIKANIRCRTTQSVIGFNMCKVYETILRGRFNRWNACFNFGRKLLLHDTLQRQMAHGWSRLLPRSKPPGLDLKTSNAPAIALAMMVWNNKVCSQTLAGFQ